MIGSQIFHIAVSICNTGNKGTVITARRVTSSIGTEGVDFMDKLVEFRRLQFPDEMEFINILIDRIASWIVKKLNPVNCYKLIRERIWFGTTA